MIKKAGRLNSVALFQGHSQIRSAIGSFTKNAVQKAREMLKLPKIAIEEL